MKKYINLEILYYFWSKRITSILLRILLGFIEIATKLIAKYKFVQPYWIEITTQQPSCIYYFGPFGSYTEAEQMRHGYIEDLVEERAIGISVKVERCRPTELTITNEELLF